MFLKCYSVALILFIALDFLWLGVFAKSFYQEQIGYLFGPKINWLAAIAFYLLFVAGLTHFVISPALIKNSWSDALIFGAFFGIVTYSAYDLTNLATIKDWPLIVTIVDLCWGALIGGAVSVATFFITLSFGFISR